LALGAYSRWPCTIHYAACEQAYDLQVAQICFLPGTALQRPQYSILPSVLLSPWFHIFFNNAQDLFYCIGYSF
jgi:hypothetical protein